MTRVRIPSPPSITEGGLALRQLALALGLVAPARRREHQQRRRDAWPVARHQRDDASGDAAREGREQYVAEGQREDPRGEVRAGHPGDRTDQEAPVLEEIVG